MDREKARRLKLNHIFTPISFESEEGNCSDNEGDIRHSKWMKEGTEWSCFTRPKGRNSENPQECFELSITPGIAELINRVNSS